MIIVDTSIWIEFFKAHQNIFPVLKVQIEEQQVIGLECIFGELLQGVRNKTEKKRILDYWNALPKKSEAGLWIEAGILSAQEKYYSKGIGLIDSFLIAALKKFDASLWTLDKKLLAVLSKYEKFDTSYFYN